MPAAELVKNVAPGDSIEFDMNTYSHFGVYTGEQSITSPGSRRGAANTITGDLVHLTKESDAILLEWLKEQRYTCRKNNSREEEYDPKEKEEIVQAESLVS